MKSPHVTAPSLRSIRLCCVENYPIMRGACWHTPPPWAQSHGQAPSYPSNSECGCRSAKAKKCLNSNQSLEKLSRTLSILETHPWFLNRIPNAQRGWLTSSTVKVAVCDDDTLLSGMARIRRLLTLVMKPGRTKKTLGMKRKHEAGPSSWEWKLQMKPLLKSCAVPVSLAWGIEYRLGWTIFALRFPSSG